MYQHMKPRLKQGYFTPLPLPCVFLFFLTFSICQAQNISINTTGSPAAAENMLEVKQTNAAANAVAIYAINSGNNVGTGYGLYATKTGAGTTNIGGYFNAQNGVANYALVVPGTGGNTGIGISTPSFPLHVNGTMQLGTVSATTGQMKFYRSTSALATTFQAGNATANVTYTWPTNFPGTSGFALTTNGAGTLSWASTGTAWSLTGNAGTSPPTNFIGTTDLQGFVVKTNTAERIRVLSTGNVGFGMNAPASLLHVAGPIRSGIPVGGLGGATATTGSLVFFNSTNSNFTGFQSGAATSSVTYKLPLQDGANTDVLQTDGAGNMSWVVLDGSFGPAGPPGPPGSSILTNTYVNNGTASFVFSPGAGTVVFAELWGGGGGGGGGNDLGPNSGGGGGGGCYGKISFVAVAGTYTAYIGAGGAGGASRTAGSNGGNSYIVSPSATVICVGGGTGGASTGGGSFYGSGGGAGGVAVTAGIISCDGGEGGVGGYVSGGVGGTRGGGSPIGTTNNGGGGGAAGGANGGCGGRGGGGGGAVNTVGHNGGYPGGGGGGGSSVCCPSLVGGNGANGCVTVAY